MAGEWLNKFLQENREAISFEFTRSGGPGGQNVNKVATAVRLRFDLQRSSLPQAVKDRLFCLAEKGVSRNGILTIRARRYRTQEANRRDAITRLEQIVRKASRPPKARKKTKPTHASKLRRLELKHRRGKTKIERKKIDESSLE